MTFLWPIFRVMFTRFFSTFDFKISKQTTEQNSDNWNDKCWQM